MLDKVYAKHKNPVLDNDKRGRCQATGREAKVAGHGTGGGGGVAYDTTMEVPVWGIWATGGLSKTVVHAAKYLAGMYCR